ncbi:MAG: hypothetical protein DRO88_10620 [Promethearchaeia archaeon]|nr:MAG: hypothetical protein DRO88_10620 [Candidatus Lokiarchaeia archaeon]
MIYQLSNMSISNSNLNNNEEQEFNKNSLEFDPSSIPKIELNKQEFSLFQIDALKAIAMVLVIMDHSFTHQFLHQYGAPFWERIAIPIFMIIMGFNIGLSFRKRGEMSLEELYSWQYFEAKLRRYMIPYLLLYFIHGIIRLIVYTLNIPVNSVYFYDEPIYRFLGYTFFFGPGLWFIPVIFGSILIFPLIYYFYTKFPTLAVIVTFEIELLTHGLAFALLALNGFVFNFVLLFFLYSLSSMLSAVGIGLWLSTDYRWNSLRNVFLWIIFPIGILYMVLDFKNMLPFNFPFGDYHMFYFMYSGGLFMIAMRLFPKNPQGKLADFIRLVSKATYHILLAQIFYFSIIYQFFLHMNDGIPVTPDVFDGNPINYLWYYPLNLIITFSIGIVWYRAETHFHQKRKNNVIYQQIYQILIKLSFIAFILWLVGKVLFLFFA